MENLRLKVLDCDKRYIARFSVPAKNKESFIVDSDIPFSTEPFKLTQRYFWFLVLHFCTRRTYRSLSKKIGHAPDFFLYLVRM